MAAASADCAGGSNCPPKNVARSKRAQLPATGDRLSTEADGRQWRGARFLVGASAKRTTGGESACSLRLSSRRLSSARKIHLAQKLTSRKS